jgi:aspartokinase-like uncharacterized kinase
MARMTYEPLEVIKVGGSLLNWPELGPRLRDWLCRHQPARRVLLAGGGEFVDLVRQADRAHGLGEETSHWLAIRALSATAELLHALLPETTLAATLVEALAQLSSSRPVILDPWNFLHEDDSSPDPLPHSWDVTSDSIAARVAVRLGADELILLKSSPPPSGVQPARSATESYVDPYFSRALSGLRVSFLDLRHAPLGELQYHSAGAGMSAE